MIRVPCVCCQVRFLTVPGSFNGKTFPPGTGNVDAIVPSGSFLLGTSARAYTTTVSEGADELGGGFSLVFRGEKTEMIQYTADATSIEAVLEVRSRNDGGTPTFTVTFNLVFMTPSSPTWCLYRIYQTSETSQ